MSDSSPQLYPDLAPDILKQRVARFVLPNERIVIVQRHHLAMIIQPIVVFVAAFLAAVAVDVFSAPDAGGLRAVFWVVALGAFLFMSTYLSVWLGEYFIVTHKRVMKTSGVLNKKVHTLPLGKVVDFTYDQSIPGRIFGYGVFDMVSAGDHPLGRVKFISRPMRTYLEISNLLFGPGSSGPKLPQDVRLVGVAMPNEDAKVTDVVIAGRGPRLLWPARRSGATRVQDVRVVEEVDARVTGVVLPNKHHPRVQETLRAERERHAENQRRMQRGEPPLPHTPSDVTEVTADGENPTRHW